MQMFSLNIRFKINGSSTPDVSISVDKKNYKIKLKRWVQFLSLLTFRNVTQIDNGQVSLQEISRLSAFSGLTEKQIAIYLHNSYKNFHKEVTSFIRSTIDISSKTPYALFLDKKHISANLKDLSKFLKLNMLESSIDPNEQNLIWSTAEDAFEDFQLDICRKLYQGIIEMSQTDGDRSSERLVLSYLRLSQVDRYSGNGFRNSRKALRISYRHLDTIQPKIRRDHLRSLLLANEVSLMPIKKGHVLGQRSSMTVQLNCYSWAKTLMRIHITL